MAQISSRANDNQHGHDRQSSGSGSLSSIRCNVALALMRSRTSFGGPLDFDLELGYKSACEKRLGH